MNFAELIEALRGMEVNAADLVHLRYNTSDRERVQAMLGPITMVHEVGGGEGGGEHVVRVVRFDDHGVHMQLSGSYYSSNGTDWDDDGELSGLKEVVGEEVKVTRFKEVPRPTKLSYKEVLAVIAKNSITPEDLDDGEATALGRVKTVESKGGGEGGGESVVRVFHLLDHDVYLKCTGSYYSSEGTEWDDEFVQVFPRQVNVTQYHIEPQPKEA